MIPSYFKIKNEILTIREQMVPLGSNGLIKNTVFVSMIVFSSPLFSSNIFIVSIGANIIVVRVQLCVKRSSQYASFCDKKN